ncbi:MAG: DUF309 domain-containing protein [Brevibacillus sp.]|nr:DUF309 domain-containing protein [Brevibacillus sp.]
MPNPYPEAYLQYLCRFHGDRDYFECHEILEEYWKTQHPPREIIWVGLIQIAVALYHQRRGNYPGAIKMMNSALHILKDREQRLAALGLDPSALLDLLTQRLTELEAGEAYRSLNLPIVDADLLAKCKQRCAEQGFCFGQPSRMDDEYLLHKHRQRDRSSVIRERQESLKKKQQRRAETANPDQKRNANS